MFIYIFIKNQFNVWNYSFQICVSIYKIFLPKPQQQQQQQQKDNKIKKDEEDEKTNEQKHFQKWVNLNKKNPLMLKRISG